MMTFQVGDGMTAGSSQPEERQEVLMALYGEASPDAIKYGFYIGELSEKPVADYEGKMCQKDIPFMEFKNSQK
ncbi:MAG: hypothetical protein V4547_16465 [Bacteroidota bacterium]